SLSLFHQSCITVATYLYSSRCCLFCCSPSSDYSFLHSFPTRRSSDLFALDLQKWRGIMQAYEDGGHAYYATLPTDALTQFRDTIDRKSTRLNSSHVSISYAVFCLKKKNSSSVTANIIQTRVEIPNNTG